MENLTLDETIQCINNNLNTLVYKFGVSKEIVKRISDEAFEIHIAQSSTNENCDRMNLIINNITIKPANIIFNLKKSLELLFSTVISGIISLESLNKTKIILLCLVHLGAYSITKLDDKMVCIVNILHNKNGYYTAISKDVIIDEVKKDDIYSKLFDGEDLSTAIECSIDKLQRLKVINATGNNVTLQENVVYLKNLKY